MRLVTNVVGVKKAEGELARMIAVDEACSGIVVDEFCNRLSTPKIVIDYLANNKPEEIDLGLALVQTITPDFTTWEVDLSKLPENTKTIRITSKISQ